MNRTPLGAAAAVVAVVSLISLVPLAAQCPAPFQRGDSNQDDRLDLSDPIATLGHLFLGTGEPGCLEAADADDSGKIDLSDAVFTVGYLFLGQAPIPPPIAACGADPTPDALGCIEYLPCGAVEEIAVAPCTTNDCCPLDSYCEKDVDDCSGVGVCVVRPDACPRLFDPWCGCDGNTYGNRCEAAAAGVNVVHRGDCNNPGGCLGNEECDPGSYCLRSEGACDDPGQCTPMPDACPKILDPVCGCDGVTYSNDCLAGVAGVSVAYRGECLQGAVCNSNGECDPEEYCFKEPERCDEAGVCQIRPDLCAEIFDPVCGCDGRTYGNSCFAGAAGVSVARKGPCDAQGDCRTSADCEEDSYCSRPDGFCDDPGFCRPYPDPAACVELPEDPVCGCDGITYGNSCLAAVAGVTVLRTGSCEEGRECMSNDDCSEPYYCFKKESFCADPGLCFLDPSPEDCQAQPDDPICGCDDQTYRNECEAARSGVAVAYRGACDGIPRCQSNKDCEEGSYCAFREGFCGGLGVCTPVPVECDPELVEPVCGCDGNTYLNACFAAQAGVSIASGRKCEIGNIECTTGAFCGGGQYCAKAVGDCDGNGSCEPRPSDCSDDLDPVCGCDGITYDNDCKAHAAGVNLSAAGPCAQ
ncbi:MAG TPA: Kazal-type serine protease inhibitor domain-containing protein [Planctomycetota bacterium]|nr:Kazal-type serine protease inhibitor domain-containing protein [Planctomycetota bacterium]